MGPERQRETHRQRETQCGKQTERHTETEKDRHRETEGANRILNGSERSLGNDIPSFCPFYFLAPSHKVRSASRGRAHTELCDLEAGAQGATAGPLNT